MPQVDLCKTCKPESLTIIQLQKITVDLVINHPKASYKENMGVPRPQKIMFCDVQCSKWPNEMGQCSKRPKCEIRKCVQG